MPDDAHRIMALLLELRKKGIVDFAILSAIEKVPREEFVSAEDGPEAYVNTALPIGCGQTSSQPFVVAKAAEALEIKPNMRVLEIGTGSGYQAAVLAHLCRRVYTIERHKPLMKEAETHFRALGIDNVVTWHGDGLRGWPEQAPFDRILLSASVTEVPQHLIEQLKPGGILVAPVGPDAREGADSPCQYLTRVLRTETGIEQKSLLPVVYVPMVAGVAR